MKVKMQRRELCVRVSQFFGIYSLNQLMGCGQFTSASQTLSEDKIVTIRDIQTHVAGMRGFRGDILKAKDIASGQPTKIYVREGNPAQGGHQHAFILTKENFLTLLKGQSVTIVTERVNNHTHTMVIDPTYSPGNAESVQINLSEYNSDNTPQEPKAFHVAVDGETQPVLYISVPADTLENSPEYCFGTLDHCKNNQEAWSKLPRSEYHSSSLVYRVAQSIETQDGQWLQLRAQRPAGLIQRILRIARQGG